MESLGSVVYANGLILPVRKIELVDGATRVETGAPASELTDRFPVTFDFGGEWRLHAADGTIVCTGREDSVTSEPVINELDYITVTITMTVSHDKKTTQWQNH